MNLIILFNEDFIDENVVEINDRRLNHVMKVHKANEGDYVKVGLLNGKIGTGLIRRISKKSMELKVDLFEDSPAPLDLKLILAMPRPKALKRIIQDVTTLGIKEIYIIKTWRVEKSYWSSSILDDDTLFKHMILGLEQGKDTKLPKVYIEKLFKPFVEDKIPKIIEGTKAIVAHPTCKKICPRNVNEPVTLAIGPEGGFIDYEIDLLEKNGFSGFNIGKRILRVETAIPNILGRIK